MVGRRLPAREATEDPREGQHLDRKARTRPANAAGIDNATPPIAHDLPTPTAIAERHPGSAPRRRAPTSSRRRRRSAPSARHRTPRPIAGSATFATDQVQVHDPTHQDEGGEDRPSYRGVPPPASGAAAAGVSRVPAPPLLISYPYVSGGAASYGPLPRPDATTAITGEAVAWNIPPDGPSWSGARLTRPLEDGPANLPRPQRCITWRASSRAQRPALDQVAGDRLEAALLLGDPPLRRTVSGSAATSRTWASSSEQPSCSA